MELKRYDGIGFEAVEVVFLCLARDCAPTIGALFTLMDGLAANGIICGAAIGENGSADDTAHLIDMGSRARPVLRLDTSFMSEIADRLQRMAAGREYLKEKSKQIFPNARTVIVADLDNVLDKPPEIAAIIHSINLLYGDGTIFAISSGSLPSYYDLIAYDDGRINFEYLYKDIATAKRNPLTAISFMEMHVFSHQRVITRRGAHRVISSFNGLCLYKANSYYSQSYIENREDSICEHLVINRRIAHDTGQEVLISDALIISAPSEHAPSTLLFYIFLMGKKHVGKVLKRIVRSSR